MNRNYSRSSHFEYRFQGMEAVILLEEIDAGTNLKQTFLHMNPHATSNRMEMKRRGILG